MKHPEKGEGWMLIQSSQFASLLACTGGLATTRRSILWQRMKHVCNPFTKAVVLPASRSTPRPAYRSNFSSHGRPGCITHSAVHRDTHRASPLEEEREVGDCLVFVHCLDWTQSGTASWSCRAMAWEQCSTMIKTAP